MEIKLSVVMTAYNAERYLVEAIQSIIDQTFKDFEIILVNDGSEDETLEIMLNFQKSDDRIIIDNHENIGMAESVNRALKIAKSNLIARIDADDIMFPDRLEKQYKFMNDHRGVSIASSNVLMIGEQNQILGIQGNIKNLHTAEDTKKYIKTDQTIYFPHTACIFRKDHIVEVGGYNGIYWPCDDVELFNRVAENNYGVVIMPDILMKYRLHGGSVMTSKYFLAMNKLNWIRETIIRRRNGQKAISFENFLESIENKPFLLKMNWYRKRYGDYFMRNAGFLVGRNEYLGMAKNLFMAALLRPFNIIPRIIKIINSRKKQNEAY